MRTRRWERPQSSPLPLLARCGGLYSGGMARRPRAVEPHSDPRPADALFGWVADFDSPEARAAAGPEPRVRAPRVPMRVFVGGGSVLAVAATIVTALMRPFETEAGVAPRESPSATAVPGPVPTAAAAPSLLPDNCSDLYGQEMLDTLAEAGLVFNGVWTGSRQAAAGTIDAELRAMLGEGETRDCYWLGADGGEGDAVLTTIAEVDAAESQAAAARLGTLGYTRLEERGGTRYFVERHDGREYSGESHVLRDGLWFATHWYGTGPFGYTAHIVERAFA